MSENAISPGVMANAIRALSMDAVQAAKSGHPGMPMGAADMATALFTRHMKIDPRHPDWPDRDRFVLSAGHGSMLLYALHHLLGFSDMTMDEIRNFRQLGARTAGHPEYGHALGIETTTGPLGQGIATAVGMALAERMLAARFGDDLVDHRTWVIAGDGCLMEGVSQEAISLAGHLRLDRLTILFDDNHITIDGPTSLSTSEDPCARFAASGWHTIRCDGHDFADLDRALTEARKSDRPTLVACRTVIGKGSPNKAGKSAAHGAPLGPEEIALARAEIGWPYDPFVIPDDVLAAWRGAGARGRDAHEAWKSRLEAKDGDVRSRFLAAIHGELPADLDAKAAELRHRLVAEKPEWASRKSSQVVLETLTEAIPALVGGSADLTGSNLTATAATPPLTPDDFTGRHINYGVREHGMAAAMNGIALHGGFIPYGGTFLVFTDYCRPALRLAALMRKRTILVGTHDSIGLGEDGPTHQPIEHLASLRAMPNMRVYRPADAVETLECWLSALRHDEGPSVLSLSRQNLPTLRDDADGENLSARGGYVIREAGGERRATILATGSEVCIALEAAGILGDAGIPVAVVSLPCFELFERQDPQWRRSVLGTAPRIAVEAASPFGWTRYVDSEEDVVGLRGFGASGPPGELYTHFGITPEAVAEKVRAKL